VGDGFGGHCKKLIVALSGILGGRTWAIEDRDDDDQCKSVGSGELGRVAVFGDTAKDMRGSDGDGGAGGLASIKLELDFHCRGRWWGTASSI
jgi:hypothetical protein